MTRRLRNDEGSAAGEALFITPLLILVVMGTVQFGVWLHAVHTAQAVASQSLQTTRVSEGSAAQGRAQAETLLSAVGRRIVLQPTVDVVRDAQRARVTIHGQAQRILPLIPLPIAVTASGPVERVTAG